MPQSREIELSKAISMPGSLMNTTGNALDVRYVANNETDRISIPKASRFVGLQVYQTDTETLYILKDSSTTQGVWEKVAINSLEQDLQAQNVTVAQSILPETNGTQDIGSPEKRFRSIYVDEAYLSTNTLYIGDTPVLGTSDDTVMIKADADQSINLKTSGAGTSKITSQSTAEISTSGMNADVVIQATGQGSMVRASATEEVRIEATDVSLKGDVTISKNLTVAGNVTIQGSTFEVDATTVTTKDNIIVLNKGEVGSGVTNGSAGIQVDRGDAVDYQLIFDETDDMFKVGTEGSLETVATRPYVDSGLAEKADASHSHSVATTSAAGFMSSTDKAKLDGITASSTKVEESSTNGNIKINGTETTVYVHPEGTNPHGTTKDDVGLGNVPNVATNDQTPTFTTSSTLANLISGEKLTTGLGKISKAISDFIDHVSNRSNPHGVTASQIGAETPDSAQAKVDAHAEDEVAHITAAERELWNSGTEGPQGEKGDRGDTGVAATIQVGTVITGAAGSNVTVTNSGTVNDAVLNFSIPRGETGEAGATPTIKAGTVTTGNEGTDASVTASTSGTTTTFNFTIPRGATGSQGLAGADGLTTSVTVNGTKYSHTDGNITLPNYPTLSSLGAAASSHTHGISDVTNLQSSLDAKANLASPALTGTPTAPTASVGTNTTQVATTAFVTTAVDNKTSVSGNAGTATKLETARTINGTSFNGSANITTANWGTAREIKIADSDNTNTGAAVSVNGGSGHTLKLPATIKASLTGNASTATKLATARTINGTSFDGSANITFGQLEPIAITASSDLNSYTNPGMYYCAANATASGLTNCPVTIAFSLLVEKHAGVKQTITQYTNSSIPLTYTRNYYNGTWGSWYGVPMKQSAYWSVNSLGSNVSAQYSYAVGIDQFDRTFFRGVIMSSSDLTEGQIVMYTSASQLPDAVRYISVPYYNSSYVYVGTGYLAINTAGTITAVKVPSGARGIFLEGLSFTRTTASGITAVSPASLDDGEAAAVSTIETNLFEDRDSLVAIFEIDENNFFTGNANFIHKDDEIPEGWTDTPLPLEHIKLELVDGEWIERGDLLVLEIAEPTMEEMISAATPMELLEAEVSELEAEVSELEAEVQELKEMVLALTAS